jgi:hypothetical protein
MVTMTPKKNGLKVQSSQITCTVPGMGMIDHVVLEIVAALNDLSVVQFDLSETVSASVSTCNAFTGLTQNHVATGLAGSVRLLCGNNSAMSGSSETEIALVASWMQAAEQTVLPMIRHGT